jgi:hypothetical protein
MPKDELLPGVTTPACPPPVVCDAHRTIRSARRRALARDAAQLTVLAAVDYLFIRWPESRVPFLNRGQSLTVLTATNAAIAAHLWSMRYLVPRFMAWRAATTWSRTERARFTR